MHVPNRKTKERQREGKRPICYSNGGLPHWEWQVSVVHGHIVRDVHLQLQIGTSSSLIPGFSTEVPFVYSARQISILDFTFPRTHPLAVRCIPLTLCQPATGSDISTCPLREKKCHWLRTNEVQPYYFADKEITLEKTLQRLRWSYSPLSSELYLQVVLLG